MGICGGKALSPEEREQLAQEKKRSRELDDQMRQEHHKDQQVNKLLLLGAGESGKSTLFKQMLTIYGKGFPQEKRIGFRSIVHGNLVQSIQTLIQNAEILSEEYPECTIHPQRGEIKEFLKNFSLEEADKKIKMNPQIGATIESMWEDAGIQNTFEMRAKFQLFDSAKYFLDETKRVTADDYIPTHQDVLRSRVRTTGIVENKFEIDGNDFSMFDVGGQRNERKKWIHCFQDVTAVLFVAALSAYDLVLFEDETTNRMFEALQLFDEICNSRWFKKTSMILMLNKKDLFAEKIKKVPLTVCFDDYDGPPGDYDRAIQFIQKEFESMNNRADKQVYTHITCATDTNNMRVVFDAVKDIVIRRSLREGGLIA